MIERNDDTPETATPTALEAELHRWFGNLLSTVGPHIPTSAYNMLSEGRDNLKAILHAARTSAAHSE